MELEVVLADGTFTTLKPLSPEELEAKLSLPGLEGDIYRGTFRIAREQREEIDRRFPKIAAAGVPATTWTRSCGTRRIWGGWRWAPRGPC